MKKYNWVFVLAAIALSPPIAAQELEEIVVSAQRREESLQEVPVSITAFSAETLEQQHLKEAKDYFKITPNVNFTEDGETGHRSVGISMRGVSDFANSFTGVGGLSNSFGIYLDEFNIANNATKTANPQLQDLERLEVLRGPQGTYFGSNATGGALNLTTKLPHDETEYEINGGYSRFNTWEVGATVNAPITDTLFVRGNVYYEESDGFLRNLSPTGNDDAYDHVSFRVAARWLMTDAFTADVSFMRTVENDGTDTNVNSGIMDFDTPNSTPWLLPVAPGADTFLPFSELFPVDAGSGFYPDERRVINKDFYEFNKNRQNIFNARLNYQGDNWSLRSITGVMKTTSHRQFDQDLVQYSLYRTYGGRTGDTFSQEVRFNLESDTWDWTVGAFYSNDDADTYGVSPIGSDNFYVGIPASFAPDGTIATVTCFFCLTEGDIIAGSNIETFDSESWAVFSEANWQFTEQLKATVGIRYTEHDLRSQSFRFARVHFSQQPLDEYRDFKAPDPGDPRLTRGYFTGSVSSDSITPRFVLNWSPNDNLNAYASVSRGYKPGGLTIFEADGSTIPFSKESLWNYEVGAKWRGADGRLQVNGAFFFMDWEDLQIPSVEIIINEDEILNNFQIINSQAESIGFELEAQALLMDNFVIGGGVGYLDAEFKDFGPDDPFVVNNMAFDLDGVTVPRAPKWTANLFGQYDVNIGGLDGFLRAEWSYRSSITSDVEATVAGLPILDNAVTQERGYDTQFNGDGFGNGVPFPWPRPAFPFRVPSYDIVNLRAGISGDRWSITGYIENLFDKNYYTGTQENFGLGGFRIRPHFRIAGVNLRLYSK
ncbi:MAG: TonB-dependent receptor [Gammaproteobacteria bacterium]|nr:TonB-dependent receptor [Gammaproteobacteria bacterium]